MVNRANFYTWAQDFGFKYRGLALNGQYFLRWLNDFRADGPLPISSTFDHGFEASVGNFFYSDCELYARTSFVFGQFRDSYEYCAGFNWYPLRTGDFEFVARSDGSRTARLGTSSHNTKLDRPGGCPFCKRSSISNRAHHSGEGAAFLDVAETLNEMAIRSRLPECGWTQCVSQLGKTTSKPARGAIRTGWPKGSPGVLTPPAAVLGSRSSRQPLCGTTASGSPAST